MIKNTTQSQDNNKLKIPQEPTIINQERINNNVILPQIHPQLYSSPSQKNSNINTLILKYKSISKGEYSSKDIDTNIHYSEVTLTNPKEY